MHTSRPNRPRLLLFWSLPAFAVALLLACIGVLAPAAPTAGVVVPAGGAVESVHVALGAPVPTHPSDEHVIVRPGYVVAYSPAHHEPAWVSWRLVASDFGSAGRHKGHFLTDMSLPASWGYRATHNDYTGTSYQRGHLLPSEERTSSPEANEATFLLSNVAPQRGDLNEGPWRMLEKHCRLLAEHEGRQLAIAAGPIWDEHPATIGHDLPVPTAFWKLIVVQAPGDGAGAVSPSTTVIAAVMPNADGILHASWTNWRTTLREVEARAGYRLLGRVTPAVHDALAAATGAP